MEFLIVLTAIFAFLSLVAVVVLAIRLKNPIGTTVEAKLVGLEGTINRVDSAVREELSRNRTEATSHASASLDALRETLDTVGSNMGRSIGQLTATEGEKLDGIIKQVKGLTEDNERRQENLRQTVESRLDALRADNADKLEKMRETVDEKLQGTLEKRLGESFALVSERLDKVHQGLGEMQALATGVGDLKRLMGNVRARGTYGEGQCCALLEEVLTPEQFYRNAKVREQSQERVEFAIRLPGRDEDAELLLPIDSKFPIDDYERLIEASERADAAGVEDAGRALEQRVRAEAKKISAKYINPPTTTNFAILFVPTESLYAEILRRPGLAASIQRDHGVTICGPNNLCAYLNALQMGFQTLAIQKRSSEVWKLLGQVKTEFGGFAGLLSKVQDKLTLASKAIDEVGVRTRVINRKLSDVQAVELPPPAKLLGIEVNGFDAADPGA